MVDGVSGKRSVPSVVALSPGGGADLSLENWEASQGVVFYSFKRIIGLELSDISPTVRDSLRYEIRPDLSGMTGKTPGCVVSYGEAATTPVALSTVVVRHLLDASSAYHGGSEPIAGAVVAGAGTFYAEPETGHDRCGEGCGDRDRASAPGAGRGRPCVWHQWGDGRRDGAGV